VGKRRTRRQKQQAKHQFAVSWTPQPQKVSSEANVKSQIEIKPQARHDRARVSKKAQLLAKQEGFEAYGKDVVKSLILASIILATELVLYLAWK
jgi:hypothetical protein